jgi:phosphopantothenoylcysteine synthetase/decarboxylase
VAPATANIGAKFANGIADDVLSAIYLATRAPVFMAPAMNGKMWDHPATRENVERLLGRGIRMIGPEEGMLACGYEGIGRMWPVDAIIEAVEEFLAENLRSANPDYSGTNPGGNRPGTLHLQPLVRQDGLCACRTGTCTWP